MMIMTSQVTKTKRIGVSQQVLTSNRLKVILVNHHRDYSQVKDDEYRIELLFVIFSGH